MHDNYGGSPLSATQLVSKSRDVKPRVTADAIAAAKARPIAAVIGAAIPLKRDFALCPFHTEKTPSLFVRRRTNTWTCYGCGARGDTIEFIRRYRGVDFADAVAELAGASPIRGAFLPTRAPPPLSPVETPAFVLDLWNSAHDESLVRWYLWSRNILPKSLPAALRGHRAVWCAETRQKRPAVLAALTDARSRVVAVQRIWVTTTLVEDGTPNRNAKGARALDLAVGKKTVGSMGSAAVRLAEPVNSRLGLGEGVETSLAVALDYRMPMWAVCGLSRLGHPAHWSESKDNRPKRWIPERAPSIAIPPEVRQLTIFGDRGAQGELVADFAAYWYRRQGLNANAVFPETPYKDFAEMRMGP